VQTIPGFPAVITHQYPVVTAAYQVAISVNEADGTFQVPVDPQFDAMIPDATSAVVAKLYLDVLGRSADVAGLTNFVNAVNAGVSLDTIIRGLISSPEYKTHVINDLYLKYLGRPVDDNGLQSGLAFLNAGGDPRELAARLVASDEFLLKSGGTNEGFLHGLYETVLGHDIDPATFSADLALLNGDMTVRLDPFTARETIALAVIESPEARTVRAEEFYQQYLERSGDPGGIAAHAAQLAQESETDVAMTFLTSQEFQVKAQTV